VPSCVEGARILRERARKWKTDGNEAQDAQNHRFNLLSIPSTSRPLTRNVPGTYNVKSSMPVYHTGKKTADSKRSLPFHRLRRQERPFRHENSAIKDVQVIPTQHSSRALST
jgi:hypothetical protein